MTMKRDCLVGSSLRQPAISFDGTDLAALSLKIRDLEGLNKKTISQLEREGCRIIADLAYFTKEDICRMRNIGELSYKNLRAVLDKLCIKMEPYE